MLPDIYKCSVSVIGLGYVGLPLAVELAKNSTCLKTRKSLNRNIIGFDINSKRIKELKEGIDSTNELTKDEIGEANLLRFTSDKIELAKADVFIVTVPTPIDKTKNPDMTALKLASQTVGEALKNRIKFKNKVKLPSPIVIFESTVYPGATEEVCVPIIEKFSDMKFNNQEFNLGFYCGYSPERMVPGDPNLRLTKIKKVTSGSNEETSNWIDNFYSSFISAGTHKACSIKVAEACKIVENVQRDLNIALVNELAIIFKRMNIDTLDVLEAAGTKWNFLPFKPGLVGGHCIGVDPYYFTYKAAELGYYPEVVHSGRRINDDMGKWIAQELIQEIFSRKLFTKDINILILGFSFKKDCVDTRNTGVYKCYKELKKYKIETCIVDPIVDPLEAKKEYGVKIESNIPNNQSFTAVIGAVDHTKFKELNEKEWLSMIKPGGIFFDVKGYIPRSLNPIRI